MNFMIEFGDDTVMMVIKLIYEMEGALAFVDRLLCITFFGFARCRQKPSHKALTRYIRRNQYSSDFKSFLKNWAREASC